MPYPYGHRIFIFARSALLQTRFGSSPPFLYSPSPSDLTTQIPPSNLHKFQLKSGQTPKRTSLAFSYRERELCFPGLSIPVFCSTCCCFLLVVLVAVVLVVAFSYCRKLWPPDVGLCFQVCTGTLTLHNCRSPVVPIVPTGLRFTLRLGVPFRFPFRVCQFVSWDCDRSVSADGKPITRFPNR